MKYAKDSVLNILRCVGHLGRAVAFRGRSLEGSIFKNRGQALRFCDTSQNAERTLQDLRELHQTPVVADFVRRLEVLIKTDEYWLKFEAQRKKEEEPYDGDWGAEL